MSCTHQWQQIDVDPFRQVIRVRCPLCQAIGIVTDPTSIEINAAFYASESTPIEFDDWQRVSSANVETECWSKDLAQ